MAHEQHEFRHRSITYRSPLGTKMSRTVISLRGDKDALEKTAAELHKDGSTEIAFVTEVTRWKGKNGKKTTIVAGTEPYLPAFDGHAWAQVPEQDLPDGTLSLLRYADGPLFGEYRVCYRFDGDEDDDFEQGDQFWIADFADDESIEDEFEGTEARTNADEECDDPLFRAKAVFQEVWDCPETYVERWIENHGEDVPLRFFG